MWALRKGKPGRPGRKPQASSSSCRRTFVSVQGTAVAVIGGGLGGLAAACVAAARGHKLTLYDKNAWLGGKAAVLHEDGFRFDMGPTILTGARGLGRLFGGG